jgi:hypothetical protein
MSSAWFASCSEQDIIAQLLQDKDSKSTKTSTKLAIDLLKQFCVAKGLAFEEHAFKGPSL